MTGSAFIRTLICLASLLACLAGTSVSAAESVPPRVVRVVMDNNYPPFAFLDNSGKLQGILVDQWRLWERKTGILVELQGMDWGEALRRIQRGEFDVIDTIFKTEARLPLFDFSLPYQRIEVPIFFDKDIAGITDAASLKGFPVAVKEGDAAVELLRRQGVTHLLAYPSYEAIVKAAAEHKVNVFVVDKPPALYFLYKYAISDKFRASSPLNVGEFHRAVVKGNGSLLQTLERGFAAIAPEEYKAIEKRWYGSDIGGVFQMKYLGYGIATAGAVIVVLLVSNRILRRSVTIRTAELAASEARYRTLVDNIPLGISLIDRNYRIVMVNRTMADLFGHPPEWFAGRQCYNEYEKRDQTCVHCPGSASMATGGVAQADTEGVRDDGSRFPAHIHTVPLAGGDGTPEAFIEVVEDVTERRQAQQSLENERTRLRTLLQTIPDLIWLKDPDGVYLACNQRFERLFGATEDQIIGKTDYDFVDRELADFFREHDCKAIAADKPAINEEWVTYADDGHKELLETIKTPMRDASGTLLGVLGVARNITEKRELEEERLQLESERERSQRLESLGILAGGIAHDFNNILTGILGNVSFARIMVGDDHKAAPRLAECEKAAKRAGELTQQLLTFARGGEPVRRAIDTKRIMDESLSFALRGAAVKGVVESQPDIWWLDADAGQMSQVFNNLLINAKQAMPDGGTVTVRMENLAVHEGDPFAVQPGSYVRIVVSDQGCGIPADNLQKIFDPYFTTKAQGSGLGLASVYSIVKRHGGMVAASSTPGEGSAFTLLLPAAQERSEGEQEPKLELPQLRGTVKILVMDDEEMIRETAVVILEELGYAVESCADGSEAVALNAAACTKGSPYDAIILDLTVPGGMGGMEAAAMIRDKAPDVPLIVSSGYSNDTVVAGYQQYGFSGVVLKPYTMRDMATELLRVVEGRRTE